MIHPPLGTAVQARREAERLRIAAIEAVEKTHADGLDLDDPRGAALALGLLVPALAGLPLPASGGTEARFAGLAAVAGVDVALGRLAEAHADALAILRELGGPRPAAGQLWGVWAAEGPASTLTARPASAGGHDTRLEGLKPWCSGATFCTHALVTAADERRTDVRALYAVALAGPQVAAQPDTWRAVGLAGTATQHVLFESAPAVRVGDPGTYLTRPGFWHGAVGVAAAWWGAAADVAAPLYAKAARGGAHPHALAHLGAVETGLRGAAALLREAAATIDAQPWAAGEHLALLVRSAVEAAARDGIDRVGKALGPGPQSQDRAHARRVADLGLYLGQSHAERDLARLGSLASEQVRPGTGGER